MRGFCEFYPVPFTVRSRQSINHQLMNLCKKQYEQLRQVEKMLV